MATIIVNAVPHRKLFDTFNPTDPQHLAIIIHNFNDTLFADNKQSFHPMQNSLHLIFDDEETGDRRMCEKDAQIIKTWLDNKLAQLDIEKPIHITVSCKGGSCRSAAIACVIEAQFNGDESAAKKFLLTPDFLPNRHVFTTTRIALWKTKPHHNADIFWWNDKFKENRLLWDKEHL